MTEFFSTKKRRSEQLLWSKLDQFLLPYLDQGVVLAISGGPDSRALLEAVASWPKRLNAKIIVASIDHGMRKEAIDEAQFIAARAKRLGFISHHESILNFRTFSGEKDLRIERFRILKQVAVYHSCRTICLAHHSDDNAEGYFMALMGVGGGELGAAMNEIDAVDGFYISRPFLSLDKKDLILNLSLKGITDFVIDSLDENKVGQRAYVRYEVFPNLFRLAPGVKKRLKLFAKNQREKQTLIDKLAKNLIIWHKDLAQIDLSFMPDKQLIISAIWQILKKWSNGKDLRACQTTIDKLVKNLDILNFTGSLDMAGLDPKSNKFNLNHLNAKLYQFPGVQIYWHRKTIVAKRI
jgi:tRNA(Ile)-lysidine synthetase-like protein